MTMLASMGHTSGLGFRRYYLCLFAANIIFDIVRGIIYSMLIFYF